MREDLAHLTIEALTQFTNAGLVKRAVREMAGGYRPAITVDADQALHATFPDGIQCTWPPGLTVQNAHCTCAASGVCRHRLITVLVYREDAAEEPPKQEIWAVSDEDLARLVPAAFLRAAERARADGVAIDLTRAGSAEPCDTARLPSATVRYWGGGALEAARCDCVVTSACEHVVLGVWAFRAARDGGWSTPSVTVRLGPPGGRHVLDTGPFEGLVRALLQDGVLQGTGPLAQGFTLARIAAANAAWLALLISDLENWAEAYSRRSSLYEPGEGVNLVAELALRLAAGVLPGNAGRVLGVDMPGETALDRLRLMGIGARTRRDGERRLTSIVLVDTDTATRLVLRHEWTVPEPREGEEMQLRAAERVAPGVLLDAIAQGQLLAQQAARRADGSVRLARARSSQNSVLPQSGDWSQLAQPVRFESAAALRDEARAHPNAALQPRHAARRFIVFSPQAVQGVRYDANEQTLFAGLSDAADETVLLQRTHERHTPHALDAIAAALGGKRWGPLRHVAGVLDWQNGVPRIDPWALACDRLVVPDLAERSGALADVTLGRAGHDDGDTISSVLERLQRHLATTLHHGARRLPSRWRSEGSELASALATAGLKQLSSRLRDLQAEFPVGQALAPSAEKTFMALVALLQLHQDATAVQRFGAEGAAA